MSAGQLEPKPKRKRRTSKRHGPPAAALVAGTQPMKRLVLDDDNRKRLVEARHRSQLSQAKVAKKIGASWNMIAMCERNTKQPSVDFLDRWARAVGLELVITLKRKKP
jgi:ribosome-binding protein aMBF1 (putative translation factor)